MDFQEKPKRQKDNAIRTIPEACAAHVSRMNLEETDKEDFVPSNQQVDGFARRPKRPKVYAIRTFPEGCGAHVSRMNLEETIKEDSANMISSNIPSNQKVDGFSKRPKCPKVYAIRTFPEGCGAHVSGMNVEENNEENSATMVLSNSLSNQQVDGFGRKPKHRKAYALSRSVEGCGAHTSRMDLEENNEENSATMIASSKEVDGFSRKPKRLKVSPIPTFHEGCGALLVNNSSRDKVMYALNLFRKMVSKLQVMEVYNGSRWRVDMKVAKLLKMKLKWINTSQLLGDIPGVQVGDRFEWMAELNVIGLHHQFCSGIDYMKKNGKMLATSIVASGRYTNVFDSSDALIYSGHGGNPTVRNSLPQDQKLERGNLALKNSMEAKTPVRVIRGLKFPKSSKLTSTNGKNQLYVYDGLYCVHDYWQERGHFGKLVFKFSLQRILGQPKLLWLNARKEIKKLKGGGCL